MKKLAVQIFIASLFSSCDTADKFAFNDKWQSLNDRNFVIEITDSNNYIVYRNGDILFDELSGFDDLEISIIHRENDWFDFTIVDRNSMEAFTNGRIERKTNDRIRVYFHKHHDILDLADEFHRTNDLVSFDSIMKEIR